MNFFDTYDVSGAATPPTNTQPTQSLNEEVSEVVGQLSRFWGGFRKQSQVAFEAARKDLGSVVQQAQKEFTKLTEESPAESSTTPESSTSEQAASTSSDADAAPIPSSLADSTSSDATDKAVPNPTPSPGSQSSQPQTIFSRLQASLPPALANVQSQLPEALKETLKHARVGSANLTALDFAQLRSTIATELQRVQGATEEYVHRSEDFLREAGEFLKDAVKVVPPEEGDSGYPGLIWDGTDVWMLPTTGRDATPSPAPGNSSGKGKERETPGSATSLRPSVDSLRAVATRAESMLKQLRHDPEVIKADPKDDANVRDMYTNWLTAEAASEDRGLGTTAWQNKIERALADPMDGAALNATMDTLVPETLIHDEFWTRYFFRVHQVEREEARRKAIIQGTTENDEDFSWEDDDEETVSPTARFPATPSPSVGADQPKLSVAPPNAAATEARSLGSTPANLSPRQSSEESYDVVSSQVSNSGTVDGSAGKVKAVAKEAEKNEEEDDDDDEEEDEDDDDEEEEDGNEEEEEEEEEEEDGDEEEEEESDWE
ncbi:hypothetical protein V8D89_013014 [Ganoderma adspersum]